MGSITETPTFEKSIYLIQETDPVLGGEDGTVNIQPKQLTNRTAYLKALLAVQHLDNGQHAVTNEMVAANAAISESKLALDHSTTSLYAEAQANLAKINALEATIDNIAGSDGSAVGALGRAVPLSWKYSEYGFDFELFASSLVMRNIPDTTIIGTVSGDESVDCGSTANLKLNEYYVLSNTDGTNTEVVQVDEILSPVRFRNVNPLTVTRTAGRLGQTSWNIKAGSAEARNNSVFISRTIDVNKLYNDGKLIIRRDTSPAYFTVYWKADGSTTWVQCEFLHSVVREVGYKDDEFKIPGGVGKLRVDAKGVAADRVLTIDHLVVFPYGNIVVLDEVKQPVNVSPAEGTAYVSTGTTLQGSTFRTLYGETKASSTFQIATDVAFTDLVMDKTVAGTGISTTIDAATVQVNTNYFWRYKYTDSLGNDSQWSEPTQFSTSSVFASVTTPTVLSPTQGSVLDTRDGLHIVASAFSMSLGEGTHVSSDWKVSTDPEFATTLYESTGDTVNKTDIMFEDISTLLEGQTYYVKTRYNAELAGGVIVTSQWSVVTSFSIFLRFTAPTVGVVMLAQGGYGGTWARIDGNFSAVAVDGTYFNTHPVFGGMVDEIIDGQHMVRIPKFYYKVGTVASGTYAGKSYWMISDQMVDGFAVHPAFKDAGVELDRVYVGKYQASSASSKMQSIPGVLPAVDKSLDTFRTEANARNVSGVTGFMQWTMYQLGAIQMLYLIENATMDSQTKTGMGRVNTSSAANVDATDVAQATYRGIVGLWGNVFQWIDGFKTVSGTINVWDTNGNKTWVSTSQYIPDSWARFPNTFKSGNLDPIFVGSTYSTTNSNVTCPDYQYFNSSSEYFPFVGGYWNDSTNAGLWVIVCFYASSNTSASIGSRLAKV